MFSAHPIKIPKWNHGITKLGQATKTHQYENILRALISNCDSKSLCHRDWKCSHFLTTSLWSQPLVSGRFARLLWQPGLEISEENTSAAVFSAHIWLWVNDWMLAENCSAAHSPQSSPNVLGLGINQKIDPVSFFFSAEPLNSPSVSCPHSEVRFVNTNGRSSLIITFKPVSFIQLCRVFLVRHIW